MQSPEVFAKRKQARVIYDENVSDLGSSRLSRKQVGRKRDMKRSERMRIKEMK